MASILRYCVAGPKKQYFTGSSTLDLAYITPNLIVCSMPTSDCIKGFYRIWLPDLLAFLEDKHTGNWRIWNFQTEKSGYGDGEVGGRVEHFGFPDHHPPPFEMLPAIVSSIDSYLSMDQNKVAVLHCKQGKGRSGTVACAYLMTVYGMTFDQATDVFTRSRMRPKFGQGISILSQRRYLRYMHDFVHVLNRQYKAIEIQIDALKIWRPVYGDIDVRLAQYAENGASLITVYGFNESEIAQRTPEFIVLAPRNSVCMPADVCMTFQHSAMVGGTIPVLHSTAYMWFNAFFETYGCPEGFDFSAVKGSKQLSWMDLDGFKGTQKRGSALFERLEICWHVSKGVPI